MALEILKTIDYESWPIVAGTVLSTECDKCPSPVYVTEPVTVSVRIEILLKSKSYILHGTRGRTRTGTVVTPVDFESTASTNFATLASELKLRAAL